MVKRGLLAAGHYHRKLAREPLPPGVAFSVITRSEATTRRKGSMAFEGLHVRAAELEAHCRLIRESCDPIRLSDWLAAEGSLPGRPVLVTFDDGYRSVFTLAKPILERYEIPAVVFVTTRPAIERQRFWYDRMAKELGESAVEEAKSCSYDEWSRRLRDLPAGALADGDPHAPMTVEELRSLARHPLFELGGHTSSHPILARASADVQRREIEGNRQELESVTGVKARAFAYPNGATWNRLQRGVDSAGEGGGLRGRLQHATRLLVTVRVSMGTFATLDAGRDRRGRAGTPSRLQLEPSVSFHVTETPEALDMIPVKSITDGRWGSASSVAPDCLTRVSPDEILLKGLPYHFSLNFGTDWKSEQS